jgi:hypothetical protein
MGRRSSTLAVGATSVAFLALAALALPVVAAGAKPGARAHMARSLNGIDTGHLHLVRASGSRLFEEGSASGVLRGGMRVHMEIGATFRGSFTIYARGGSVSGSGSAVPHGSGRYESFAGSFVATHGTGRYRHVSGRGGLYGTFDRRTYNIVFQTLGKLSY